MINADDLRNSHVYKIFSPPGNKAEFHITVVGDDAMKHFIDTVQVNAHLYTSILSCAMTILPRVLLVKK